MIQKKKKVYLIEYWWLVKKIYQNIGKRNTYSIVPFEGLLDLERESEEIHVLQKWQNRDGGDKMGKYITAHEWDCNFIDFIEYSIDKARQHVYCVSKVLQWVLVCVYGDKYPTGCKCLYKTKLKNRKLYICYIVHVCLFFNDKTLFIEPVNYCL